MLALAQFNLVTLAVALLVGVATGWWMFARRGAPQTQTEDSTQT